MMFVVELADKKNALQVQSTGHGLFKIDSFA